MKYISLIFILPLLFICSYYLILGLCGVYFRKRLNDSKSDINHDFVHTFAIVMPAHNEESTISHALESCSNLDYPKSKFDVFVVADNCTDKTEKVSSRYDVHTLVRKDNENRGKGFALQWAFEKILNMGYDAVVVLDADCDIDRHALKVFDNQLKDGEKVLQSKIIVSNPDQDPISYVFAVGNMIENDLFYLPKSALGLSVFLCGTGMVFTRDILEKHPWAAYSIVEDVEYSINLLYQGVRVKYLDEVVVPSVFPANEEQLYVQRTRWARGNLAFGKYEALKLIWKGICTKNYVLADAGWSFLTLSRPLVLLIFMLASITSGASLFIRSDSTSYFLFCIAMALGVFLAIYFISGILMLGLSKHRAILLLKAPMVIFKLIIISLLGLLGADKNKWVRTPRS